MSEKKTTQKERYWYFEYKGEWFGPIKQTEMIMLMTEKKIGPDTIVYHEGMGNKKKLKDTTLCLSLPKETQPRRKEKNTMPFIVDRKLAAASFVLLTSIFGGSLYAKSVNDQHIQEERIAKLEIEKQKQEQGAMAVKVINTDDTKKKVKEVIKKYQEEEKQKKEKEEQEKREQEEARVLAEQQVTQQQPVQQPTTNTQTSQTPVVTNPTPVQQPVQQPIQNENLSNSINQGINPNGSVTIDLNIAGTEIIDIS